MFQGSKAYAFGEHFLECSPRSKTIVKVARDAGTKNKR